MKDKCQICKGERGGVPGNENIEDGVVICDYCHCEILESAGEDRLGTVALCSRGQIGLITSDRKQIVKYPDGTFGLAWTGIHLSGGTCVVGKPWSSRRPEFVGKIEKMVEWIPV